MLFASVLFDGCCLWSVLDLSLLPVCHSIPLPILPLSVLSLSLSLHIQKHSLNPFTIFHRFLF